MKRIIIRLDKVSKEFRTRTERCRVLNEIDLSVEKEEIVCIMGPSGCGKSTLLNILGGIIAPSSGEIVFDGVTYKEGITRDVLGKVGYIFQEDNLLQWRNISKNLDFPLEIMKLKGEAWKNRKDQLLDMVGLTAYKDAYPFELSGGMKQRISVIRALMHDPDVLIMDQPFGALDAITRKMLRYDFLNLWKKTRKTIVMVTNDLDEGLLLSTRILIMGKTSGNFVSEIRVDIPIDDRDEHIAKNNRYIELRKRLKRIFDNIDSSNGSEINVNC